MESIPDEDTGNTVEVTAKDLEYSISLFDKAAAGLERTDSSFERSSPVGKILSDTTCCREIHLQKDKPVDATNFTVVLFKEIAKPPNLQQPPCPSVSSHQHLGKDPPPAKR